VDAKGTFIHCIAVTSAMAPPVKMDRASVLGRA
jgi:hypothetical protein